MPLQRVPPALLAPAGAEMWAIKKALVAQGSATYYAVEALIPATDPTSALTIQWMHGRYFAVGSALYVAMLANGWTDATLATLITSAQGQSL